MASNIKLFEHQHWSCSFMQRYVVTLDLARKLKAAGWRKATCFQWYSHEHMNGKWQLGRVNDEPFMLPAPMADEVLEDFPRSDIGITILPNGFLISHRMVDSVQTYRLVDALAELWILVRPGNQ